MQRFNSVSPSDQLDDKLFLSRSEQSMIEKQSDIGDGELVDDKFTKSYNFKLPFSSKNSNYKVSPSFNLYPQSKPLTKEEEQLKKDSVETKSKIFKNIINASKVGIFTTLLSLALKQGDTSFISKKPKTFLRESAFLGIVSSIPMAAICYSRIKHNNAKLKHNTKIQYSRILNTILISTLIFMVLHIILEFTGARKVDDDNPAIKRLFYNRNALIGFSIVGIGLAAFAMITNDSEFRNENKYSYVLELLLFVIFNGVSSYTILCARHPKAIRDNMLKSMVFGCGYGILYMVLDAGGFFRKSFPAIPYS